MRLENTLAKRAFMKRSDFKRPGFPGCAPHTIFKIGGQCLPYIHRQSNASSSLRRKVSCGGMKKLFTPSISPGLAMSEVEVCRNLLLRISLPGRSLPARSRLAFTRSPYRRPVSAYRFTLVADNQLIETVGRLRGFLFHCQLVNRP